jgi:hypothetical protein
MLPASCFFRFLIKINNEIVPESSGSSLLHFPFSLLSKSITKLPRRAQDHLIKMNKEIAQESAFLDLERGVASPLHNKLD